jgi:hypothetical protein
MKTDVLHCAFVPKATEVRRSGETPRDSIYEGAVINAAFGGFALKPPKETKTTVS